MRKLMLIVFAASLMAAVILGPTPAQATCTQTLYCERAFTDGAFHQLVGRTTSTATIIWFCSTGDPEIADVFFNCTADRNRVQVTGNASSCATTGTFRSLGTCLNIFQQP